MRLDLGGVGVPFDTEIGHKALGEGWPVNIRIGHMMGIVVAYGAVHLAQWFDRTSGGQLPVQSHHDVGEFLAQSGWRSGLSMGARQHGLFSMLVCEACECITDSFIVRDDDPVSVADHEGMGEVINILAGAAKMHEFADRAELRAVF